MGGKMACPYCNSDEWKTASLVYRDGLSVNQSKIRGSGIGIGTNGVGIGVGRARMEGYQQSILSVAATPPKKPTASIALWGLLIFSAIGLQPGEMQIVCAIIFVLCAIGILYIIPSQQRKYRVAVEAYANTRMCLRCGRFYRPSNKIENKQDFSDSHDGNSNKVLAIFVLIIAVLAILIMTRIASTKPTSVLSSSVADDSLEGYGDAHLVEFFGQIEGVGVLAKGGEHLGADGDDFAFHRAVLSSQFSV
jgi:hypothetical protein